MGKARIHHEDPTLRLASDRGVLVATWFDAPTADQMRVIARAGRELGHGYPSGIGFANVVVRGNPRFDDEVRAEAIEIARERIFRRGSCHIVLVEGLAGAATRAFLSMVLLVGKRSRGPDAAPTKVFGDCETAARWFVPMLDGWSAGELASFFRSGTEATPKDV
ncbi:MAG TPA: hypothetical protein VHB21_24785 [Minicystis sp.]|nr:hypothetical protein [Minicystis sp.]